MALLRETVAVHVQRSIRVVCGAMETVTLDTNSIRDVIEARDPHVDAVREVIELHANRVIELAVTSTVKWDVPRDPLAAEIDAFLAEHRIEMIGSVAVLGQWKLGRDMLGSSEFTAWTEEVRGWIRPPKIEDQDFAHLHGHYLQGRDVFLTRDRSVLHISSEIRERWGFSVMTPADYMEQRQHGT
jgi:hypothetical protein